MSSAPNSSALPKWAFGALLALALGMMAGCIADTAEDTDLPWARNQGWEGMIPLPYGVSGQND